METQRTARLSAGTIRYRVCGPHDAPVLVFVHGLFVSGSVWDPVVDRLAARFRCIVPTFPMGSHEVPMGEDADLAPAGMADIVADFLDALDLRGVVLVGNDSGGAICQLVVTSRPERVGGLVLTTCDAFDLFPPPPFGVIVALARFPALLGVVLRLAVAFPALTRLPIAFGLATKRPLDTALAASWIRPSTKDRSVLRDVCKFLRGLDREVTERVARKLPKVTMPALVLWAREDRTFPMRLAEALVGALPDAELETVDDAWVFASLDAPAPIAAAIGRFVDRRLGRRASTPAEALAPVA